MNPSLRILTEARELIKDPKNWTQGSCARDMDNLPVSYTLESAYSFCARGAIFKATDIVKSEVPTDAMGYLTSALLIITKGATTFIPGYNDSHEHSQVLALFDKAIKLAERIQHDDQ